MPKPLDTSQEILLTSEEHARLAEAFANPDPGLSPEALLWWQRLAHHHASLSKLTLKRD
jgi:hypothetical protein